MKKFIMTTMIVATIATGFAGQTEAAAVSDEPVNVYTKEHAIQLKGLDQEKIQSWIEQVCQTYKQPTVVEKPELPIKEDATVDVEKQPTVDTTPVEPSQPNQPNQHEPNKEQEQQSNAISQEEQQMVDLVNSERAKQGLAPLKVDMELTKVARIKAQDMITNNYFAHESPTYGSPFDMLNRFGVEYRTAGENLAGNQTVQAAHTALMNSDGHRANILNGNYTEVGIGVIDGGSYGKMFVQLFKG